MGTGRFVPRSRSKELAPDQPPEWVRRRPEESLEQWRDRIQADFLEYQLNQGFTHDIVALKRHELASKHLWPIKQELDIGQKQPDWMRNLTDDELLMMKVIRDRALSRTQQPQAIANQEVTRGVTIDVNGGTPGEGEQ